MLLNNSLINTTLINGASEVVFTNYNITIVDSINIDQSETLFTTFLNTLTSSLNISTISTSEIIAIFLDTLNIDDNLSYSEVLSIIDLFLLSSNESTSSITSNSLLDSLILLDTSLITFKNEVLENYTITEDTIYLLKSIDKILDKIKLDKIVTDKVTYLGLIQETFDILSYLSFGSLEEVADTVGLLDNLNNTLELLSTILEIVNINDTITLSTLYIDSVIDTILKMENIDTVSLFKNIVSESISLSLEPLLTDPEYISYLLSPETFSVTTYNNYNFTGSCKFNNSYLFINKEGLYKYGGTLDIDKTIQSEIKTAALSFGSSSLKQLPNFYLGLSNSNKIVLKVSVDGKATVHYKLNKRTENLQTQLIALGKGLIGRYFQFELITQENTQLEIDSMEFMPLTFKRKL